MAQHKPPEIIQIIPATNWHAVYWIEETGEIEKEPVICFALLSDGVVEPMTMGPDGYVDCPTTVGNFLGYINGPVPSWMVEDAAKKLELREQMRQKRLARGITK